MSKWLCIYTPSPSAPPSRQHTLFHTHLHTCPAPPQLRVLGWLTSHKAMICLVNGLEAVLGEKWARKQVRGRGGGGGRWAQMQMRCLLRCVLGQGVLGCLRALGGLWV